MSLFKAFCNSCNRKTNHSILTNHKVIDYEEIEMDDEIQNTPVSESEYRIVQCNGCENVSYLTIFTLSGSVVVPSLNEDGFKIVDSKQYETFYPERLAGIHFEKKIPGMTHSMKIAYHELIEAYNKELFLLASAGLRLLVESICNHFRMEGENLPAKIRELSTRRLISNQIANALKSHKFLGDKALHNLIIPPKEEIKIAIEILELTLQSLFKLPLDKDLLAKLTTDRVAES